MSRDLLAVPRQRRVTTLHLELSGITPAVWRRVLVPTDCSLGQLHTVIQRSFGWLDEHLHQFDLGGAIYMADDPENGPEVIDERRVSVGHITGEVECIYCYDFGDRWRVTVTAEGEEQTPHYLRHAVCLSGARACPPENCGGTSGYLRLLGDLADPHSPEHYPTLAWVRSYQDRAGRLEQSFDPDVFSVAEANVRMQRPKRREYR